MLHELFRWIDATHSSDYCKIMSPIYIILMLELIILLHRYIGKPQLEMNYEICSAFSTLSDTKDKRATESRKKKSTKLFRSIKSYT